MSNVKMKKPVSKYMAEIGSRGGSACTARQSEARKSALIAARLKRWPGRDQKNNLQLSAPTVKAGNLQSENDVLDENKKSRHLTAL